MLLPLVHIPLTRGFLLPFMLLLTVAFMCYLGALLKPGMKKQRSVTKLSEKDLKKTNDYVLAHQGVDSDGDFSTKFFKVTSYRRRVY